MTDDNKTILCECRVGCQCAAKPGPAVYVIERNGQTLQVCGRCDLPEDKHIRVLTENNVSMKQIMDHDPFSALLLAMGHEPSNNPTIH